MLLDNQNKNNGLRKSILSAAILLALMPSAATAEDITYSCQTSGSGSLCSPSTHDGVKFLRNQTQTWNNVLSPAIADGGSYTYTVSSSDNTVILENTTASGVDYVVGASHFTHGLVKNNTVIINDGIVNHDVIGAISHRPSYVNNTVTINGGHIKGDVYGTSGGGGIMPWQKGNTVNLYGGKIDGNVYTVGKWGKLYNNGIINIYQGANGKPQFSDTTVLKNKEPSSGGGGDTTSKSTLALHTTGITAGNIEKFRYLHFYAQPDTKNGDTFLTLKTPDATDISQAKVGVGVEGSNQRLKVGDTLTLINKEGNGQLVTPADLSNAAKDDDKEEHQGQVVWAAGMQGIVAEYEFEIKKDDNDPNNLIAVTQKVPNNGGGNGGGGGGNGGNGGNNGGGGGGNGGNGGNNGDDGDNGNDGNGDNNGGNGDNGGNDNSGNNDNNGDDAGTLHPQTTSLLESGLAGLDFVNRGADLANGAGMSQLRSGDAGLQAFGALRAGNYRTETGSHIDVKGANILLGAGGVVNNSAGQLHIGAYVEGGTGSYDSFNDFTDAPDVRADGDTKYYGVGAMARQTFANNLYLQAGVRAGESDTDYHSSDLQGAVGASVDFSTKRDYAGANIGVGYTMDINDKLSVTPSAQLLYTDFDKAQKVVEGSTFNFDSIDSLRSRVGAEVNYQLSETSRLYGNLAWEREHRGEANGKVLGMDMLAPTIEGNTGIIEIGTSFAPNKNLKINLGAAGNVGKRRGIEANASMRYRFD